MGFQKDGFFPERLYFTLLTPRVFFDNSDTRIYGYKMKEYQDDNNILEDTERTSLEIRSQDNWIYPDIKEQIKKLKHNWVCFEDILEEEFSLSGLDIAANEQGDENIKPVITRVWRKNFPVAADKASLRHSNKFFSTTW